MFIYKNLRSALLIKLVFLFPLPIYGGEKAKDGILEFKRCINSTEIAEACHRHLAEFIINEGSAELALKAGQLVVRSMEPWFSLSLFKLAIEKGKKTEACSDAQFSKAVISGLWQTEGEGVALAQELTSKYCWKQLEAPLLEQFKYAGNTFFMNVCPIALKKGGLSNLRRQRCQRAMEQKTPQE